MTKRKTYNKDQQILAGIYESSLPISMTALVVVAILEIAMLVFSVVSPAIYKGNEVRYRIFYIVLLTVALVYMGLNQYVKKDVQQRYVILNKANPLCAIIFFCWAMGITISDIQLHQVIDPSVFMTFSLTVPLSFYLRPSVYAAVALAADAIMLYLTALVTGFGAVFINLSLFIVFQFVLGISFLRTRTDLAETVVKEKEIALKDAMTGFFNRRAYIEDMDSLASDPSRNEIVYIAIDVNGLKEVNDEQGHEAGDKLLSGAATCMERIFGELGTLYRIGGDEFVVLAYVKHDEIEQLLADYEKTQNEWSNQNNLPLAAAIGYAFVDENEENDPKEAAKNADQRMYEAKALYYQKTGKRRHRR